MRRDPGDRFKLKEFANGTSILRATVNFKSGQQALELNRFIDCDRTARASESGSEAD